MAVRKGIILAGGSGTRLEPKACSKQLERVYDKPMVYFSLSTLMLAGLREILVITTAEDQSQYQRCLKDGSQWGLRISYAVQPKPEGLAQAFIIGQEFIGGEPVALILGDNIFYGHGLVDILLEASQLTTGGLVFGYRVKDARAYGVVAFNPAGQVVSIEEKPTEPKSNYALVGLYFFDGEVSSAASTIRPSARGELEITELMLDYQRRQMLRVSVMGRGIAWLDTGTPESLLKAAQYVQIIEERQGLKISCPEEIAWRKQWITNHEFWQLGNALKSSAYGQYLLDLPSHDFPHLHPTG